jgi:cytoskeletal protein CcmA (bactofilin family)
MLNKISRNETPETIVAAGMRIEGELKSPGNIKIDGIVSGKVHTSQELLVGSTAQIEADLIAGSAVIAGIVRGNITVKNSLMIAATGKLMGNVNCGSIAIEPGAYFSGTCRMSEPKKIEEVKE